MHLTDLGADLVRIVERDGLALNVAETVADAHALRMRCPCNGHSLVLPFPSAPAIWTGNRWQVSGTTVADLTLSPSVHVVQPCGWHGWIRGGLVTPA